MNEIKSIVPQGEIVVPLTDETAVLQKRIVTTGRVRISTVTENVSELTAADLEEQEVEVVRVPIDREVIEVPAIRTEGDVTIIPVMEEVIVVEKRLVLREELHIHRRTIVQRVEVPVSLQKQRAIIEKYDGLHTAFHEEDQK